jgi:hypothetical protein
MKIPKQVHCFNDKKGQGLILENNIIDKAGYKICDDFVVFYGNLTCLVGMYVVLK